MLAELLGPLIRSRRLQAGQGWEALPRPLDDPSVQIGGADPERVLLFGSGPAAGWGVTTHDRGLPGHLARRRAQHTGRGCEVDVIAVPILPIGGAATAVRDARLWRYDVIAVTWGLSDALALTPVAEWGRTMAGLLAFLHSSSGPTSRIIVAGIQPVRSVPLFDARWAVLPERHVGRLNTATRGLCAGLPRVTYVDPPPLPRAGPGPTVAPAVYEDWARTVSDAIAS